MASLLVARSVSIASICRAGRQPASTIGPGERGGGGVEGRDGE